MRDTIRSALAAGIGASGYTAASGQAPEEYTSIIGQIFWFGVSWPDMIELGGGLALLLVIIERSITIWTKIKSAKGG